MEMDVGQAYAVPATDVERAYVALAGKQELYDLYWDYYDGRHPLLYSARKLRDLFEDLEVHFNENWIAVVINTILDRIAVERFQVGDDRAASDELFQLWRDTGLSLDAYDAHLCALVTGESFIVCGEDEDGPHAYYNDSRLCHMFYRDDRPNVPRFAAKWWEETEIGTTRVTTYLTLYYPDRLEYYSTPRRAADISSGRAFELREDVGPNPAINADGMIPVFHIRRERRGIISEIADIIPLQAALNKLLADMMVAAEFGAFKQRYFISQFGGNLKLKNAPNEIWNLPGSDGEGQATSVGEFGATELNNYLGAIERSANVIATVAGIPKALLMESGGQFPSGASLRALEAPLVKKAHRLANRWEPVWVDILRWLGRVSLGRDIPESDLDVVWADPSSVDTETVATTSKTLVEAGVPLATALRRQGWTDAELDQMATDQAAEQARNATLAAAYVTMAEDNASRGQGAGAEAED